MVQKIAMAVANAGSNDFRVVKSANELVKKGFDVHVVCILKDGFAPFEKINGVSYHRKNFLRNKRDRYNIFASYGLTIPNLVLRKLIINCLKYFFPRFFVKKLFNYYFNIFYNTLLKLNADIYYAHEIWALESCYIVSKKKLKKKLIYDSHELEMYRNNNLSAKANLERIKYEKNYIKHVDNILTVSEGCAKIIKKEYNLKNKITVIRNTPIFKNLKKSSNTLRKMLNIENGKKIFIYTGFGTFGRGIELIINSIIKLPEYHLATVGNWDKSFKKDIQILVNKKKLTNRVHLLPSVPNTQLVNFISSADIAVIPIIDICLSYKYCLPNKLFESAFAGLPILASDLPELKKYIERYKLGLTFKTNNTNSFIKNVSKIEKLNIKKNNSFIKKYDFLKEIDKVSKLIKNMS